MKDLNTEKKGKLKIFFLLHTILLMYSAGGIFSKLAAGEEFLSLKFILFYGIVILNLAVYALLWQQVLKSIPLNVAYANKAITLVWGMVWGAVVFKEQITVTNVIGALVVLAGVLLMVTGGEKKNE